MMNRIVCVFVFLLLSCSGNKKRDLFGEQEQILSKRVVVNEVEFELFLMPPEVKMAILKKRNDTITSEDSLNAVLFTDFRLKINKQGFKPGKKEIEYLDFYIGRDLGIVRKEGDTLRPSICERMITNLQGQYEFLMSFESELDSLRNRTGIQFVYKGSFLGDSVVVFSFTNEEINKISELKVRK